MKNNKIKNIFKEKFSEHVLDIKTVGGMTNNNYIVETDKKKYIFKFFGKGTEKLINRELEKQNLPIVKEIGLDVENYSFDTNEGIQINEYIDDAKTFDKQTIKEKLLEISNILRKVHLSKGKFNSKFDIFKEIEKYENLIEKKIDFPYYEKIRNKTLQLKKDLNCLGIEEKNCHMDLVPENFIEDKNGKIYLIDWEYCGINDPMWDIAALFIESDFTKKEEGEFLSFYKTEETPINFQKILIFKILQDHLWSIWTIYKEEQGDNFGTYGIDRYNRMLKNLREYKEVYEKK